MARLLGCIIAVGLFAASPTCGASTTSTKASSPAPTSSDIEIDVIFPIVNATYNITESLPIVFALQNLPLTTAVRAVGFQWGIMPFGDVGEELVPGGILMDEGWVTVTAASVTTEPFIFVNQTNVQKWSHGPRYPDGSVYQLQWSISWLNTSRECNPDQREVVIFGWIFFNINITLPEPNLDSLVGHCGQLGSLAGIGTAANDSSCPRVMSKSGPGNTCAVKINKAKVTSISSAVQSLIAASVAATAPPTPSPTSHNGASEAGIHLRLTYAVILLLGSLQFIASL